MDDLEHAVLDEGPPAPAYEEAAPRVGRVLVPQPPAPDLEAVVIVPVRDEARHLPGLLGALARQRVRTDRGQRVGYEVLLLCNGCSDGSAEAGRRVAARCPHLRVHGIENGDADAANVGAARRLLMDEACRRLEALGRTGGVILTTDADTWVARPGCTPT